ncbi:hypothetical protein [Klebsiella aerogenes]|uniref:hypothetical protein n=1 Tax=Klebsiella aerogenes TaxID=548 RepID=UPI0012DCA7EC|nr:hypothetical protein [Klebsiella aerogenes]ELA0146789.1 hypothetical protein [Klebsiella aerogenes]HBV4565925.1 hypothetical protein [Klebsiella aerogenes]HCM3121582.1 hypothetical protein [Klebsiella aerogenes]
MAMDKFRGNATFIIQCRKVGGGMYINYVAEKEEDDPTRAPESGDKQPERDKRDKRDK